MKLVRFRGPNVIGVDRPRIPDYHRMFAYGWKCSLIAIVNWSMFCSCSNCWCSHLLLTNLFFNSFPLTRNELDTFDLIMIRHTKKEIICNDVIIILNYESWLQTWITENGHDRSVHDSRLTNRFDWKSQIIYSYQVLWYLISSDRGAITWITRYDEITVIHKCTYSHKCEFIYSYIYRYKRDNLRQ